MSKKHISKTQNVNEPLAEAQKQNNKKKKKNQ
ncbi:hypothetical protein [Cytobacillus purgationiresistens]|uniref:Uncharacterized protein n=1 Tax=Cytobacillus purgationiresistens TaxID=863449 RepID=A0ABU0AED8_9BACI|nr:hypothetical protein [Cytobacillus purgationiresistens]